MDGGNDESEGDQSPVSERWLPVCILCVFM